MHTPREAPVAQRARLKANLKDAAPTAACLPINPTSPHLYTCATKRTLTLEGGSLGVVHPAYLAPLHVAGRTARQWGRGGDAHTVRALVSRDAKGKEWG